MKVFLDTNVFLEYFEQRREYQAVSRLLSAVEDGKLKAVVSIGCVYTLSYVIRMELKRKGIHRPEQTNLLRSTMNVVMSMVTAVGLGHKRIIHGINDDSFDDMEDSFQYQCALQNKCDALVTVNLRDFHGVDTARMKILSPSEFVDNYL